jgi:hypothetical protein
MKLGASTVLRVVILFQTQRFTKDFFHYIVTPLRAVYLNYD